MYSYLNITLIWIGLREVTQNPYTELDLETNWSDFERVAILGIGVLVVSAYL